MLRHTCKMQSAAPQTCADLLPRPVLHTATVLKYTTLHFASYMKLII